MILPVWTLWLAAAAARAQDLPELPHFKMTRAAAPAAAPAGGSCLADLDPNAPPDVDAQSVSAADVSEKVDGRDFPSVFQAWQPASGMDLAESLSRHDLAWTGPTSLGLKSNSRWAGLATEYTPRAGAVRGPGVVLAELRWYDGVFEDGDDPARQYLPKGHPWWLTDGSGGMVKADTSLTWPMYRLNYKDPCFQEQVARQCKAAVATGYYDGCMLDRWSHADADQVALLKKVREAIGPDALLIVNSNQNVPTASLPYINGAYTEGFGAIFWPGGRGYADVPYPKPDAWRYLVRDLTQLETATQPPRINAVEGWGAPGDSRYIRSLTALVLCYSRAYVLYSRPNKTVPNHDHTHDWDSFWDKGLGRPLSEGPPTPLSGEAVRRDYENGSVVYNPTDKPVEVVFLDARLSRATGRRGQRFVVPPADGDIFLK